MNNNTRINSVFRVLTTLNLLLPALYLSLFLVCDRPRVTIIIRRRVDRGCFPRAQSQVGANRQCGLCSPDLVCQFIPTLLAPSFKTNILYQSFIATDQH